MSGARKSITAVVLLRLARAWTPFLRQTARATGAPIFAVSFAASRQRQLRSWDRLIIPLPWSRVVYVGGEPLRVPRHADADEVERLRQELETRLNAATQSAEAQVVHDGSRRTPTQ